MESQNLIYIFSAAAFLFGGYSLIFGRVVFYPDDDKSQAQTLTGVKARFVGFVLLVSGFLLFSGNEYGYLGLALSIFLPSILSRTK